MHTQDVRTCKDRRARTCTEVKEDVCQVESVNARYNRERTCTYVLGDVRRCTEFHRGGQLTVCCSGCGLVGLAMASMHVTRVKREFREIISSEEVFELLFSATLSNYMSPTPRLRRPP